MVDLSVASAVAKSWGKIVFLDSGNSFSPKRVAQIVIQTSDLSACEITLSQVDKALEQVMNNIVCLSVFDIFTLFEVLHQLKNNLRSQVSGNTTLVSLLSSLFPRLVEEYHASVVSAVYYPGTNLFLGSES
ncbi:hypothetical protein RND71_025534 [Anisodus tanguticus]|uniref:Uncharacterized protein n=1 Tax=Anisodus tanguticus TaxID=243964 RepID=A0AAE1RRH3_9SOLA|nr:hypothetical protein RND71_025534 [Anisodus tanguticus]